MLMLRLPRRFTFLALVASLALFAGMLVASPSQAAPGPPVNEVRPELCGLWECPHGAEEVVPVATVGESLSAARGFWKPEDPESSHFTYQWLRDGAPFTTSTGGNRHVVQPADAGHAFSVRVTYAPPGYTPATVTTGTKYVGLVATSTSLSFSKKSAPYGQAHKVKVSIRVTTADGSAPHGRVHLFRWAEDEEATYTRPFRTDGKATSYRIDAAGTHTVRLPRFADVEGAYGRSDGRLVALFIPDNKLGVRGSRSAVRPFWTSRITPKVTARVSKKSIKAGKRLKVRVRVTLPKGTPSGGRVVVRLGSTRVGKTAALTRTGSFTVTVRTRAINKRGVRKVRATYEANGPLRTGKSAPVRVRIR